MKIKFLGATEHVTGSQHLLMTSKGKQYLLDCGLYQGKMSDSYRINSHLGLDPAEIDAVILSHAHIDHSGRLPFLFKSGFRGKIYCTQATLDLCEILLRDSAQIQENDVRFLNRKRERAGMEPLKPLYTLRDAEKCLENFRPVPFHNAFRLCEEVEFTFTDAGHILGSSVVNLKITDGKKQTRLTFSGDVGRYNDLLLNPPEIFPQADYVICESTYGDRLHERTEEAEMLLLDVVRHTCVEKKGKLIIPAFSLGRTQEIVFSLDKMKNAGLLPPIQVFVDSPLSTNATDIMRRHVGLLNDKVREYVRQDPDPFGFSNLHYIKESEDSRRLNEMREPCIIISASGMMEAGRIKHHLLHTISHERNTVLIVGYCSPNTLGGELLALKKQVKIFGEMVPVRAEVKVIASYSAHADYSELIRFLSCQQKDQVKKIFLVHGEAPAKYAFKTRLLQEGYASVEIPEKGQIFELE